MEFCPKCKSMMMPIKNIYRCRKCGFEKEIKENIVSKTEIKEREVTILEKREMGLPMTKAIYPQPVKVSAPFNGRSITEI